MKRNLFVPACLALFMLTAFVSCQSDDEKQDAVMVILKLKDPGYWEQVGVAASLECAAKNLTAVVRYTVSDADYQSQLDAITDMENMDYNFKGIVAVPIYSENNHQVEHRIADVAGKMNIPVIIIDTPVNDSVSPLAGKYRTYIGTDNVDAGKILARNVPAAADSILSVYSAASNAGALRYKGFANVKGETGLWKTSEEDAAAIRSQLDSCPDVTDVVYYNGSLAHTNAVLDILKDNGKNVYSFDAFESLLDNLAQGGVVKGIMAQQTFEIGKQAIDAVFNPNVKNPMYIEPIYITKENVTSESVQPFFDFYNNKYSSFR